ncbi:MAG: PorT family protein [Treponema sp.]|nr:PorT family protein [Treponema sp.]
MRKVLIVVMVVMMTATGLYAQQEGQFTLGARVGGGINFNSSEDLGRAPGEILDNVVPGIPGTIIGGILGAVVSTDDVVAPNFNFGLYGNYAITDRLSIQAELNFMFFNSYIMEVSVLGTTLLDIAAYYHSLDIPLLFRFNAFRPQNPWTLGIMAGPHISIPLVRAGVFRVFDTDDNELAEVDFDIDNFATIGVTAGLFFGRQLGPGRLMAEMRFVLDANAVQTSILGYTFDIMRRRALNFSIGYELSF